MREAERWRQVGDLMAAALEVESERRAAFLDTACADDTALRHEVDGLLHSHAQAAGFLSEPALIPAPEEAPPAEGRRIGPYRLIREIGRGGMGSVHLAVRADGLHRVPVAVKLIRGGHDGRDVVRRFENERRILAGLRHPGIARLLDGGSTEEGLPYFVMEYVPGRPLLEHCQERDLPVARRLELFCAVCDAVQAAHQALVVHRDLKPANILVDEEGAPRLLDFGIAKLMEGDEGLTLTGPRPLTPGYASPEQARGEPVTTASDVYSLGVLLFELLTDQRPYAVEGRSPAEIERVIGSVEPPRPSTLARSTRRLAPDLDGVVLKALCKEPAERYATARELADDLRRFLDGRPVRARSGRALYRARKFARRHWTALTMAAALLAAAAGSFVFYTRRIQGERNAARREAAKAEATAAFLVSLFEASDPYLSPRARRDPLTAQALLERGTERIRRELGDQPAVRATLLASLGSIYGRLGLPDRAEELLREALAQRRAARGTDVADLAQNLDALATVVRDRGDYVQARALYEEARTLRVGAFGAESSPVADSLERLGALAYLSRDGAAAAEEAHREALLIRRKVLGEENEKVAQSLHDLSLVLGARGALPEAEALARRALEVNRRLLGDEHPTTNANVSQIAALLHEKGDLAAAEELYRRALGVDRKLLGDAHPQTISALDDLASVLKDRGDIEGAEQLFREELRLKRSTAGEDPALATTLNNLGNVLQAKGDIEGAEALAREALAIARKLVGPDNPKVAQYLGNLGTLARLRGDFGRSASLYREALTVLRRALPEDHPDLAYAYLGLGRALCGLHRPAEAEPLLRRSLGIRERALPDNHYLMGVSQASLGACLLTQNRYREAEPLLLQGYERLQKAPRKDPRALASVLADLAALRARAPRRAGD